MIHGCTNKLRSGACGSREAARGPLIRAFGTSQKCVPCSSKGRPPEPSSEGARVVPNPFLAVLEEVVSRIGANMAAREQPSAFRERVEAKIKALLPSGMTRMDAVARELGLSRQTLYRRLRDEHATFEAVLDDVRRSLALRFICEEGLSVKEAAYRLGFAEPAAFSRAFKRWMGKSPAAWRAGQGAG